MAGKSSEQTSVPIQNDFQHRPAQMVWLILCKGPSHNEFRTDYSLTLYFHLLSHESFIESLVFLIVVVSV